jgi:hypothetical protein
VIINHFTAGDPNTVAYRTVSFRFPIQFFSRSRSLGAIRSVFSAQNSPFSAKKVKSANRTVFKIKTVSALRLIYFKSAKQSATILKQSNSKKIVSVNRTAVENLIVFVKSVPLNTVISAKRTA